MATGIYGYVTEPPVSEVPLAARVRRLTRRFDDHLVINNLDLDIEHGEFVALLGASGCGKSTLLRILADLDHGIDGEVYVANRLVVAFQAPRLMPWKKVWHNVVLGFCRAAPIKHRRSRCWERLGSRHAPTPGLRHSPGG